MTTTRRRARHGFIVSADSFASFVNESHAFLRIPKDVKEFVRIVRNVIRRPLRIAENIEHENLTLVLVPIHSRESSRQRCLAAESSPEYQLMHFYAPLSARAILRFLLQTIPSFFLRAAAFQAS